MSKQKRSVYNFTLDVKERINRISKEMRLTTYEEFKVNERLQESLEYNLMIIGEAISNIPIDILKKYNEDDFYWRQIKDMRNLLIHHYWGTSLETLFEVSLKEIPILEEYIDKLIEDLEKQED